ncbi:hypothetical protein ACW2Q0_20885 [Nocardia sp. R16R-3T]
MIVKYLVDAALVTGFGVQHSVLAALRVKSIVNKRTGMKPLAWRSVESLCNIVYALVATGLWQRIDVTVWDIRGGEAIVIYAGLALSWGWYWYLHLVEYDCGLAFGSTTLVAQRAGAHQPQLENWTVGSRRWIRFPVHTAFFGMFFLLPHMTADLLLLAVIINIYNVVGSVLYDRRLEKTIPALWNPYVAQTGLIWPPIYRNPSGAASITWPSPAHWRSPWMHLPGLIVGGMLGLGYFLINGSSPWGLLAMSVVLGTGLAGAAASGAVLGIVCQPRHQDWGQRQTDLSTTVALSSAVGVATWIVISFLVDRRVPTFGVYLPLWFTVQYLGHVVAFSVAPNKWRTPAVAHLSAKTGPNASLA